MSVGACEAQRRPGRFLGREVIRCLGTAGKSARGRVAMDVRGEEAMGATLGARP